jgi:hypothetical protein
MTETALEFQIFFDRVKLRLEIETIPLSIFNLIKGKDSGEYCEPRGLDGKLGGESPAGGASGKDMDELEPFYALGLFDLVKKILRVGY